jgi:hypothetical protein
MKWLGELVEHTNGECLAVVFAALAVGALISWVAFSKQ